MGDTTNIAWTDHTWNSHWGCLKISPECHFCYAESIAKSYGHKVWGPAATTERWILSDANWKKPLKWNKEAMQEGRRHRVFYGSMCDVFEDYPGLDEVRRRAWGVIESTPWLTWQLLTKRPGNIKKMIPDSWQNGAPEHVWFGTSAGTQKTADGNIPELLQVQASVHFVSVEPQLEQVNLLPYLHGLEWIICGGESGSKHRSFDAEWALSLQAQCAQTNTAFFFKQHGGKQHDSGGCLLDGREYKDFPVVV